MTSVGVAQEGRHEIPPPTATHSPASPAVGQPKSMPHLTAEAADDTQEKEAETHAPEPGTCLLQEDPVV